MPEGVHDDVDRLPFHVEGVQLTPGDAATRVLPTLSQVTNRRKVCLVARRRRLVDRLVDAFGSGGQGAQRSRRAPGTR